MIDVDLSETDGELRKRGVKVGQHLAISPATVPRFMERFEHAYELELVNTIRTRLDKWQASAGTLRL
jgi:hypothetical protein